MLVRPRETDKNQSENKEIKINKVKQSRKQCLCSRCHKMQPYKEITVPIKYGFNCKISVLIDGIERICSVCGWHVDDIKTTEINQINAEKKIADGDILENFEENEKSY